LRVATWPPFALEDGQTNDVHWSKSSSASASLFPACPGGAAGGSLFWANLLPGCLIYGILMVRE